jgi:hypothetical protein
MKQLAGYVSSYFLEINKAAFLFISLILSCLIYFNYDSGLNDQLLALPYFSARLTGFYFLYLPAFAGTFAICFLLQKKPSPKYGFYLLIIAAPLIFAAKVSFRTDDIIVQWPLKAIIVVVPVFLIGIAGRYEKPFFGLGFKNSNLKPYLFLLLLMVPLLIMAGLTSDFQNVYPKLQLIGDKGDKWINVLVFELSYGADFFTIELFFRGFVIVAFIKYAGKDCILPMAVFYCTIHFGKPLAECISSYFGGLILGVIVYNTGSIWGGLTVHLGIAWMMELIGIIIKTTNS